MTRPDVGRVSPAARLSSVVLPDPDRPTITDELARPISRRDPAHRGDGVPLAQLVDLRDVFQHDHGRYSRMAIAGSCRLILMAGSRAARKTLNMASSSPIPICSASDPGDGKRKGTPNEIMINLLKR